jgi:CIC family chloride channel protein
MSEIVTTPHPEPSDHAATSSSTSAATAAVPEMTPESVKAPETRVRSRWEAWTHDVFTMQEDRFFLLLAVLIGIFSGLAVVCFRLAIEWTQIILLGSSLVPSFPRVVLAPTLAGLVVAYLALRVFPGVRGSGVNQTKSAVYISNGYIPFITVIGKFIACALAIGSGQSLGPEDPSLQMGAGIASLIGRKLRLSQDRFRLIAPVGAAAGLAAAFNAPISAVLFVIEEVIGQWSAGALGAIVLAAVSSVVTMRAFLGPDSLFRVPPFRVAGAFEMLAYVVLGIAGGFTSLVLLKWIVYARPKLMALPRWTHYLQPAAAGLLIGMIGLRFPQVMGAGYAIVDQAMHGQFTWKILLILAALKLLATGFSFLSGAPGGTFAPTLFIGDAGRRGGFDRASFFFEPHRNGRDICAGGNRHAVRGISAYADYFGVHGHRAFGELHGNSSGNYLDDGGVRNFARVSEGAAV